MRDELTILCLTDSSLTLVQGFAAAPVASVSNWRVLAEGLVPVAAGRVGGKGAIQATYTTVLSTVNSETGWQK